MRSTDEAQHVGLTPKRIAWTLRAASKSIRLFFRTSNILIAENSEAAQRDAKAPWRPVKLADAVRSLLVLVLL